ncbi:MAG: 50S ribosomal protein L10 [Candidatus Pacebacteria bacterium]|nr:50S ribosomal protein L10 [Candidatus Paceibacterota bacterium]
MPISKTQKNEIFAKVKDALSKSQSAVFVNFHGLPVADSTNLRKNLRGNGVSFMVAKKTITKKALAEQKLEGEMPSLDGELAIAYGDDLIAPAREVYDFQKKFEGKLAILGGIFEGKYMSKEEMTSIAAIPPLKVLRAQFVNLINSPLQGLVIALNAIAEKKA